MKKVIVITILSVLLSACGADLDLLDDILLEKQVELVFPENISECTEGTVISETKSEVVFKWTSLTENTATYSVILTNLKTNTTTIIEATNTELLITLERGMPYSWFVSFASYDYPISEIWSFYNAGPGLESYLPFPATAVSPVSGASISSISTSVNLIWLGEDLDDDIKGYDLYFGIEANPPLLVEDIEATRYNEIPVTAGQQYYWKIVTKDSVGNESESTIFTFIVG
ncbi:hypothetical protein ACOCEA_16485 [Maribacter sp. CXY002]|uniref:hypothetical protein n=1 Tax=Maribacter luteocoastalis TaxID=3407671 RepID=UPI003B676C9E